MKNNNHINDIIQQLKIHAELDPVLFSALYTQLKQHTFTPNTTITNHLKWQFIGEVITSLKQLTSYYELFIHELKNDTTIASILDKALTHLEFHYGRNCIHKVVYRGSDISSIKSTIERLIEDIADPSRFYYLNKRPNIIYTFFDSDLDNDTAFVGENEQHYRQAQHSDKYGSFYFYEQWQKERRDTLFTLAAQHDELRQLTVQYIKTIDEFQFMNGTESDLRYQDSQELLFEAPYRGLFNYSDEFIVHFIDSYGTADRWHLVETDQLISDIVGKHPNSPNLKYLYAALPTRLSSNDEIQLAFTPSFIEQLKEPHFIDELCLISATEIIKNRLIYQSDTHFNTLEDINNDEDIQYELANALHSLCDDSADEYSEDSIYLYCHYIGRLAAAILGLEETIENTPVVIAQIKKLNAKIAHYTKQILNQDIEPAFALFYGYEPLRVKEARLRKERRATPLFALHNTDQFCRINYQETPYLLYSCKDDLFISDLTQHKGVSWRKLNDGNLYDYDAASHPTALSIAHFVSYDDETATIKGWHFGKMEPVFTLTANLHYNGLQLSDDGNTLLLHLTTEVDEENDIDLERLDVFTKLDNTIVIMDLTTFSEQCRFTCLTSTTSITMSSNGKFAIMVKEVVVYSREELIYVDLKTGVRTPLKHPHENTFGSNEVALSPDNIHLVYRNTLFNIEEQAIISTLTMNDYVDRYVYSDKGNYLLVDADSEGLIAIYNAHTGSRVGYLQCNDDASSSCLHLDEESGILYNEEDDSIYAYDVNTILSSDRTPLEPITYHFGVIDSNTIGPEVDYLLGNYCCDTLLIDFTSTEAGYYQADSDSFGRLTPLTNSAVIPSLGCRFQVTTQGFSRVYGVTVKLHHPDINGKTITQWEAIAKHNTPLTLLVPFRSEDLVLGQYRFEVYSNDLQAFLFAQHSLTVSAQETHSCSILIEQYGLKQEDGTFSNQKTVTNQTHSAFGFQLRLMSDNPDDMHHLILHIEKEKMPQGNTSRRMRKIKQKYSLTRMHTIQTNGVINAYFPCDSSELFKGKWVFTLLQQSDNSVVFQDELNVIEIDDEYTHSEEASCYSN